MRSIFTIFFTRYICLTAVLAIIISVLTACSSTRLFYTFLNNFIEDEASYFFDLDEEEEIFLSQQVSEMISWHRKLMLPSYSEYLKDTANMLEVGQYGKDDITNILADGKSLIEETTIGLTPYASKFLIRNLSLENIEYIEERMEIRKNERLLELSKSNEVLYKERIEKLTTNFERFFGKLTNEQMILIEAYAKITLGHAKIRLNNRTLRQKAFINFLRTQPSETEITKYLNKLLLNGHLIVNPSHEEFSKISLELFNELLANMLSISLTSQREKIIIKLRGYAEDFRSI